MPIILEPKRTRLPQPLTGGEGNRRPPNITAVGLGGFDEFNGRDETSRSADRFLRQISGRFFMGRDRVVAGSAPENRLAGTAKSLDARDPLDEYFDNLPSLRFVATAGVVGGGIIQLVQYLIR